CYAMTVSTPDVDTLSLHDALPIYRAQGRGGQALRAALDVRRLPLPQRGRDRQHPLAGSEGQGEPPPIDQVRGAQARAGADPERGDRKSTRLNSSHGSISYVVFCLQ